VFGDYISIYDIQRAVVDKATVPIYYEGRLAKLELAESEKPKIDRSSRKPPRGRGREAGTVEVPLGQLEAVVGAEKRIKTVAHDLVDHFESAPLPCPSRWGTRARRWWCA
jgi:type I restriction enzyme R subunit